MSQSVLIKLIIKYFKRPKNTFGHTLGIRYGPNPSCITYAEREWPIITVDYDTFLVAIISSYAVIGACTMIVAAAILLAKQTSVAWIAAASVSI